MNNLRNQNNNNTSSKMLNANQYGQVKTLGQNYTNNVLSCISQQVNSNQATQIGYGNNLQSLNKNQNLDIQKLQFSEIVDLFVKSDENSISQDSQKNSQNTSRSLTQSPDQQNLSFDNSKSTKDYNVSSQNHLSNNKTALRVTKDKQIEQIAYTILKDRKHISSEDIISSSLNNSNGILKIKFKQENSKYKLYARIFINDSMCDNYLQLMNTLSVKCETKYNLKVQPRVEKKKMNQKDILEFFAFEITKKIKWQ